MSLYDGLGVESDKSKTNSWSSGFQMLKTQLEARKATLTKAKNEKVRPSTIVAPVIDLNRLRQDEDERPATQSVFLGGEILDKYFDEYEPAHPNDYEKMVKNSSREKEKQTEKDREREIEERRKRRAQRHAQQGITATTATTATTSLVSRDYEAEDMEYEKSKQARAASKVAIAPPSALMEADSKPLAAPASVAIPPPASLLSNLSAPANPVVGPDRGGQFAKDLKGSVAHKIMSKYGFKEGKGLGKDNRGMSHALQVEKTSKRGGKIISAPPPNSAPGMMPPPPVPIAEPVPPEEDASSITKQLNNPTKVVCLRNMVGPGEVDDELQGETSDECSKYGSVTKCLIYEMHNVPDDEAIRIFIEFERLESAIKALVDLNGRFFGGRAVKASFYDHEQFKAFALNNPL